MTNDVGVHDEGPAVEALSFPGAADRPYDAQDAGECQQQQASA